MPEWKRSLALIVWLYSGHFIPSYFYFSSFLEGYIWGPPVILTAAWLSNSWAAIRAWISIMTFEVWSFCSVWMDMVILSSHLCAYLEPRPWSGISMEVLTHRQVFPVCLCVTCIFFPQLYHQARPAPAWWAWAGGVSVLGRVEGSHVLSAHTASCFCTCCVQYDFLYAFVKECLEELGCWWLSFLSHVAAWLSRSPPWWKCQQLLDGLPWPLV